MVEYTNLIQEGDT